MSGVKDAYNLQAQSPIDVRKESGVKITFEALSKKALAHADLFFVGDTNHFNRELRSLFFSKNVLSAFREGGAGHVALEYGKFPLNDEAPYSQARKYVRSTVESIKRTRESSLDDSAVEEYDWDKIESKLLRRIVKAYKTARDAGLKLHPVDPQPLDKAFAYADPDMASLMVRLNLDPQLLENIRDILPQGEKMVMFYGSVHGSRFGDGLLESEGPGAIKIEVFPDRKAYAENLKWYKDMNDLIDRDMPDNTITLGEDGPHAVYFLDTGTVHFLSRAPGDFVRDVRLEAALPFQVQAAPRPHTPLVDW